jgi:hypothetical protein
MTSFSVWPAERGSDQLVDEEQLVVDRWIIPHRDSLKWVRRAGTRMVNSARFLAIVRQRVSVMRRSWIVLVALPGIVGCPP